MLLDLEKLFPHKILILDFSCPIVSQESIGIILIRDISLPKSILCSLYVIVNLSNTFLHIQIIDSQDVRSDHENKF